MNTWVLVSIGIISVLWFIFVKPLFDYSPWFNWWKENNPNGEYDCMDIYYIAYYNYSLLSYYIYSILNPGTKGFKGSGEIQFITNMIASNGSPPLNDDGIVTPKTICKTLVSGNYTGGRGSWPVNKEGWPTTESGWRELITQWSGYAGGKRDPNKDSIWAPNSEKKWSTPGNGNFLYHNWGFPRDSPLIIGFLTQWSDDYLGRKLFPSSILPLLGVGTGTGGLLGYMRRFEDSEQSSLNDFERNLWSLDKPPPQWYNKGKSKRPTQKCNGGSVASGAISGGLGGAFLGGAAVGETGTVASIGATLGIEGGPFGMIIGGLVGALAQGIASAAQSKCF